MQERTVKTTLLILLAIVTLCPSLQAGREEDRERELYLLDQFGEIGRFRYGSTWWREHHSDPYTELLMHFGKPQPYRLDDLSRQGLKRIKKEKKKERFHEMIDEGVGLEGTDLEKGIGGEIGEEAEKKAESITERAIKRVGKRLKLEPVEEPEVPTKKVYDYSPHRREYSLEGKEGITITPNGRFGSAIKFDGNSDGLLLLDKAFKGYSNWYSMAEFWMKVPEYPEKNACIFSSGGGEGRLMLRPDGHLDLVRLHPHGRPIKSYYSHTDNMEAYRSIEDLPTSLVSEDPIPTNEWVHVAIWRSEVFVINAQVNHMVINGEEVAFRLGAPMDHYNFFGNMFDTGNEFRIGNDEKGNHPFKGVIDEFRIPKGNFMGDNPPRYINPRPEKIPWRDADASRPLDFGRPYFYRNGHTFHLGFENDLNVKVFNGKDFIAELTHPVSERDRLFTDGIRGKSLTIDPRVSRLKIPINDVLDTDEGSLEFWLSPVNWDDAGPNPKLPTYRINMMRLHTETPKGKELVFPIKWLPRRGQGGPAEFRPGKWWFFCLTWDHPKPPESPEVPTGGRNSSFLRLRLYNNPTSPRAEARERRAWYNVEDDPRGARGLPCWAQNLKLKYLEIGVKKPAIAADGRQPIIRVDEVVGHDYALSPIEVYQARKRVQERLEPFKSVKMRVDYKYGIHELGGTLRTLFPETVDAATATITVLKEDGTVFADPVTNKITHKEDDPQGNTKFIFSTGKRPPTTPLTFDITVRNPEGEIVAEDDSQTWTYKRREWRGNTLGVPEKAPPPWTPVEVDGRTLKTRMTSYELSENGLPERIVAKGENLLARPVQLLEDGEPMEATKVSIGDSQNTRAEWTVRFTGQTCNVDLKARIEFDGLTRYELDVNPTTQDGTVAPLRFEIPMKKKHATDRMYQPVWANNLTVDAQDLPDVYSPRLQRLPRLQRRARRRNKRRRNKKVEIPTDETWRGYAFWTIMDLCSRRRGLYWFADNAAGWKQSPKLPAQEFRRDGDEHRMVLNLVAERGKYTADGPIVFGMIPHPAKPLPSDYRYFERAPSPQDEDTERIYSAVFTAIPRNPTGGEMAIYPREGSWEAAEEVRPYLELLKPDYRPIYLSLAWMSCRAGGYDNWRWRNGANSKVSLCDSFVEYLCWEMDEWLKRGLYNAIYLDECYAWPVKGENAVKAGQAVRLPDGSIQPGMRLWDFRQLMKRWYQLFVKYDRRPMILAHHSRNWMYPGMVFSTSSLDGEGTPMVTIYGGKNDFMDKLHFRRFELVNNPHLWGTVSFYMPSIWEYGVQRKGEGSHTAWAWRMARSAEACFAHLENGTAYCEEGCSVFGAYSEVLKKWGALHPSVEFVPYYKTKTEIEVPGQDRTALVSYYRDKEKDRILLIVSNLEKKKSRIKVTLDFEKLGLDEKPTMKVLKGAYKRPEGVDPWLAESKRPDADDVTLEGDPTEGDSVVGVELDPLKDEREARKKERKRVKLKGNVLTVPTRPHDYRVISLK